MSVSVLKKVARVPDEYQEVEYIESTGTQYIDTGVVFSGNLSEITANFMYTSLPQTGSWASISGTQTNSSSRWGGIQCYGASLYCTAGSLIATNGVYLGTISANEKYQVQVVTDVTQKTNYAKISTGESGTVVFGGSVNTGVNLLLLAKNGASTKAEYASARLYGYSIRIDNVLVRDFIPCYRKSDNVIGMYDLVNSVFYTNSGTGTFLKGEDVAPYTAERQSISVFESARLPSGYQEVEYIESSGTQWIDTGVLSKQYNSIKADLTASSTSTNKSILICTNSDWNSTWLGVYNGRWTSNESSSSQFLANQKTTIEWQTNNIQSGIQNATIKVNEDTWIFQRSSRVDIIPNMSISIFNSTSVNFPISAKLYELKLYGDDILVRDLIPCYRKSDGEIGMFDLVSGTFFTNSGTGTFAKGDNVALPIKRVRACLLEPVLPKAYQQVEYIEGSGTQRIDTAILYDDTKEYKIQVTRAYNRNSNSWGASGWNAGGMYGILGSNFGDGTEGNRIAIDFNTYYDIQQIIEKGLGNTITRISQNGTTLATFTRTHTNLKIRAASFGYPIFAVASSAFANSYDYFEYSRIKSYKIYQDETLVRNFVPCYRKSDSVVGLYDLVTKTFYTNSGTGTFSKGADATKYNIIRL